MRTCTCINTAWHRHKNTHVLMPTHVLTSNIYMTQVAKQGLYSSNVVQWGNLDDASRATNLWPTAWNQWYQILLESSIKWMKCNILKWHSRAKSSLPWRHCLPHSSLCIGAASVMQATHGYLLQWLCIPTRGLLTISGSVLRAVYVY